MTEQELAARCKSGERGAFKLLYDRYAPWMMGISMRYTGNEENSRDILHDSFVKVFASAARFEYRGTGSLKAWLARITVNTALAFLKKERALAPFDEENLRDEEKDDGDGSRDGTHLFDKVTDETIIICLGRLPARLRTVFNLFIFEDIPHSEIAERLDISESASRVRLHRAKTLLAEEIRDYIKRIER